MAAKKPPSGRPARGAISGVLADDRIVRSPTSRINPYNDGPLPHRVLHIIDNELYVIDDGGGVPLIDFDDAAAVELLRDYLARARRQIAIEARRRAFRIVGITEATRARR